MGRNAKLRKERRQWLPPQFDSPTFGLVDTYNFKGCQVLQWDFVNDQPHMLVNHETRQLHINRAYIDPQLTPDQLKAIAEKLSGPIELGEFEYTSF